MKRSNTIAVFPFTVCYTLLHTYCFFSRHALSSLKENYQPTSWMHNKKKLQRKCINKSIYLKYLQWINKIYVVERVEDSRETHRHHPQSIRTHTINMWSLNIGESVCALCRRFLQDATVSITHHRDVIKHTSTRSRTSTAFAYTKYLQTNMHGNNFKFYIIIISVSIV